MSQRKSLAPSSAFNGSRIQILAMLFCCVFGIAIIVNVQLAGNALWFWYAKLFHQGVKLYADLHIVLQPLFVLEYNAWMRVVGVNCIGIEVLSLIHVMILIVGIFLLLKESSWPDWRKAIVLAGTFLVIIQFNAYLFNDYHITSDIFSLYTVLLLLWLARAEANTRQLVLSLALGVVAGLSLTNRLNDGAALISALVVCIPLVARRRKLLVTVVGFAAAIVTILLMVRLTGDSFSSYFSNSVLRASGSKGGTGTILFDPLLVVFDAFKTLWESGLKMLAGIAGLFAIGAAMCRYRKARTLTIVAVQLGVAALAVIAAPARVRTGLGEGVMPDMLSVLSVLVVYALAATVAVRFLRSKIGESKPVWDTREAVVFLVFLLTAAGTGSTGGHSRGFYCTLALLLVLVSIFQPYRRSGGWVHPGFLSLMLLLTINGVTTKVIHPYYWHNYRSSPMFTGRVWYHHPVYGEMYIERDALEFILPVCQEIQQGHSPVEMLSLPYPYPNYFCNTPPWHGYVQTFYDTSPRATIEQLMRDLRQSPPQWIIYQRELQILAMHEEIYNHGHRLAQRDLDEMIMQKIASGQWKLVDKRNYLAGDGWFIIRTHP